MPLSIKTNLSKTKLTTKIQSKTIANKAEKQKAFDAFASSPKDFDFESYSINLVGLFAFAQASNQQSALHNALVERVASKYQNQVTGDVDLPTKTFFDVETGKMHTGIDDGKNKSLRYLMLNWEAMGKTSLVGLLDVIRATRKKAKK